MAYADFLTALMAFFLVMWIIAGVSPEDRSQLAEYFGGTAAAAPASPETGAFSAADPVFELSEALSAAVAEGHVTVARTGDTVRLEVMDRAGAPLFDTGSGAFNEQGEAVMAAVGAAIAAYPANLALEGHTDAFPSAIAGRSNWELSSDRAHAARRAIVASGIDPARIRAVSGLAATHPLNPGEPHLSANRRVSILLTLRAGGD